MLVPVDFSEGSDKAVECAVLIAKQTGARIDLIHVIEARRLFHDKKPASVAWDQYVIAEARESLKKVAKENISGNVRVHNEIRIGSPYKEISEMAKARKTDLLVISTHGFTGLKHVLMGSTTEKVVRYAPCSVLVVRGRQPNELREFKPKTILVPTDFSSSSTRTLSYALDFARKFDAQLQILHVVRDLYRFRKNNEVDSQLLNADLKKAGQSELTRLINALASKNVSARTILRRGVASHEIVRTAKDLSSDLILISSLGRTGWKRALLGSTTEEVVRHASCPVLVFREHRRN